MDLLYGKYQLQLVEHGFNSGIIVLSYITLAAGLLIILSAVTMFSCSSRVLHACGDVPAAETGDNK